MKQTSLFETASISFVVIWLTIFAAIPFTFVVIASFLKHESNAIFIWQFTLENYRTVFNPIYWKIFEKSFFIAAIATFLCLLFGYPFAYILSQMKSRFKSLLLISV